MASARSWRHHPPLLAGHDLPLLAELLGTPAWHREAACRDRPDVDWFAGTQEGIAEAVAVCMTCPVRPACTAYAMDPTNECTDGIFGALTARQRKAIQRGRAA